MTNDVIVALSNSLTDEYNDVIKYKKLAKEVKDNDGVSQILSDIAYEEFIHATHIEEILKEYGKADINNPDLKESKEKAWKILVGE